MERRKRRENKEISTQVYVHIKTDEYSKSIKNSFGFPENKKKIVIKKNGEIYIFTK